MAHDGVMAVYFPVKAEPLQMAASLNRFGTDFGLGEDEHRFFQVDALRPAYLAGKQAAPARRRFVVGDDPLAGRARDEALGWMMATLKREHPAVVAEVEADADAADPFDALARHLQEDFAVMQAGDEDTGRTLVVDVRFPSGWRPERLRHEGFVAIHQPVPGFPPTEKAARGMVRAMVDKGPYVRFVWTVTPDASLDQHPDRASELRTWDEAERSYLRVERQVTVPLPRTRSSVFLIRVYMTPVDELSVERRARLVEALRLMPDEVRDYKRLPTPEVFARTVGVEGGVARRAR